MSVFVHCDIVVTGPGERLAELSSIMLKASFEARHDGYVGDLLELLGVNCPERITNMEFYYCGQVDSDRLSFSVYGHNYGVFEMLVQRLSEVDGLSTYFLADVDNCLWTNDVEGICFKSRYMVEVDDRRQFYDNASSVRTAVEQLIGRPLDEGEDLDEALTEWAETADIEYASCQEIALSL